MFLWNKRHINISIYKYIHICIYPITQVNIVALIIEGKNISVNCSLKCFSLTSLHQTIWSLTHPACFMLPLRWVGYVYWTAKVFRTMLVWFVTVGLFCMMLVGLSLGWLVGWCRCAIFQFPENWLWQKRMSPCLM